MEPQNHKAKPTNIFVQAYKNLIGEWQQTKTKFTIFLYHVTIIGLFMPTKSFQELNDCKGHCTGNALYMIFLSISFLIGSYILMTYIEQLTILLKDSIFSQKSIANLFIKKADENRNVEINIATIILLSTIVFVIIGVYITIFPITLSLIIMAITIMLMGFN